MQNPRKCIPWVLVKELFLNYPNRDPYYITLFPYYGDLTKPLTLKGTLINPLKLRTLIDPEKEP